MGSAWLFEAERARRRELGTERTAREAAARQADVAAAEVRSLKERVEAQQGDLRLAEKKLAEAVSRGSSDLDRVLAEKAASEKRTAELADRLGEAEAARLKAEKHARELDEVMDLLAKKKVNVRRLAGLDPPPRIEVEVVAADEKKVPPVLVLRLPEDATGLEEGDRLYLLRREGGRAREVGQAVVERIDRAKGLISARIARLDAGERAAVGDRLSTYQP